MIVQSPRAGLLPTSPAAEPLVSAETAAATTALYYLT